jgi:predicted lipoprotein
VRSCEVERQGEVVSLEFHGVGVVLRFQLGPSNKGNQR